MPQNTKNFEANAKPVIVHCAFLLLNYMSFQFIKFICLLHVKVHYKLELRQIMNMLNELVPGLLYDSRALEEVHVPQGQLPAGINDSAVIVGGYNGSLWMPSLDSYFPSHDHVETLSQMTFPRSHAAAVKLNGELFVLGGVHNNVFFNTGIIIEVVPSPIFVCFQKKCVDITCSFLVESYSPLRNQWSQQPSLNEKKGCLAGASLNDKIFAFGGGNGVQCFSEVEMFDLNLGHWISAQSMMEKVSSSLLQFIVLYMTYLSWYHQACCSINEKSVRLFLR